MMNLYKAVVLGGVLFLVTGCSGTEDAALELVCEPGETKECLCGPAMSGIQICNESGSGWSECSKCQGCTPVCAGKECGPDGCGGSCGVCSEKESCSNGTCEKRCLPDCTGRVCGDDPMCGESCGGCDGGDSCVFGDCVGATAGTWKDPVSNLIWQNPPVQEALDWDEAGEYCQNLGQGGHSDWRVPTMSELRTLIRSCPSTEAGGSCEVEEGQCAAAACMDTCGVCIETGPADGCYWPDEMSGSCIGFYWSSLEVSDVEEYAWGVVFDCAGVWYNVKDQIGRMIRCVR